jgi:hypothetical protein
VQIPDGPYERHIAFLEEQGLDATKLHVHKFGLPVNSVEGGWTRTWIAEAEAKRAAALEEKNWTWRARLAMPITGQLMLRSDPRPQQKTRRHQPDTRGMLRWCQW